MSRAAAGALGFQDKGTARVRVTVLRDATLSFKHGDSVAESAEETSSATASSWPRPRDARQR